MIRHADPGVGRARGHAHRADPSSRAFSLRDTVQVAAFGRGAGVPLWCRPEQELGASLRGLGPHPLEVAMVVVLARVQAVS